MFSLVFNLFRLIIVLKLYLKLGIFILDNLMYLWILNIFYFYVKFNVFIIEKRKKIKFYYYLGEYWISCVLFCINGYDRFF